MTHCDKVNPRGLLDHGQAPQGLQVPQRGQSQDCPERVRLALAASDRPLDGLLLQTP